MVGCRIRVTVPELDSKDKQIAIFDQNKIIFFQLYPDSLEMLDPDPDPHSTTLKNIAHF
jgi:hypothetical protein